MSDAPWIMLIYSLPKGRGTARVGLWRKLKKSGALPFKTSAYLLPNRPDLLERFQWLAQEVRHAGGEASLIFVSELEGVNREEMEQQFNGARAADYKPLASALATMISRRQKKAGEDDLRELEKLRRQYDDVRRVDFFDSQAGDDVARLVERALARHAGNPKAASMRRLPARRFAGKTWLTRPQPAIDRVGSAWLIRKHIDPKATFVFASDPADHPAAIPYDMMGVEFSHHGDDCTFETLLKKFGLEDPILKRMGEMVHDADLDDGKFQTSEAFGLDRVFKGWARLGIADDEIFARGFMCFEALHAYLKARP